MKGIKANLRKPSKHVILNQHIGSHRRDKKDKRKLYLPCCGAQNERKNDFKIIKKVKVPFYLRIIKENRQT